MSIDKVYINVRKFLEQDARSEGIMGTGYRGTREKDTDTRIAPSGSG